MAQRWALLLSYQGSDFCGWQRQSAARTEELPSVGGTVEAAIAQMTGELVSVVGSGRTDSGVHAVGQVAHLKLEKREWDPGILAKGLNSQLPPSVRVLEARIPHPEFHAQRSAVGKQYSYYFLQGPAPLPHLEPFSWWIRKRLDLRAMGQALQALVGEHDFKPLQASGAKPGATIRRIFEAEVSEEPISFPGAGVAWDSAHWSLVRVRVVGSGFLKQMVRGIAGTLLQVGEGRRPSSCFAEILASGRREDVGPTAPSRALWLERVWYPRELGEFDVLARLHRPFGL